MQNLAGSLVLCDMTDTTSESFLEFSKHVIRALQIHSVVQCKIIMFAKTQDVFIHCLFVLLPSGSEEKGALGVGCIPVAILPSCQHMKMVHHNCIDMNTVG